LRLISGQSLLHGARLCRETCFGHRPTLSDLADGLIPLPSAGSRRGRAQGLPGTGPGSGTAAATLREGSASLPGLGHSGCRLPASDAIFGLLLAGGVALGCALPILLKITAKYVLFLSPCQRWDYFWRKEGVARRCRGAVGIPVPSPGSPPQLLPAVRRSSSILRSKAQPRAGCDPAPGLAQGTEACSRNAPVT